MRGAGQIRLDLPRLQNAEVRVVDATGRTVRDLASGPLGAGTHAIAWDGRDFRGRAVPSGVYFVLARATDGTAVSRWIRLQ